MIVLSGNVVDVPSSVLHPQFFLSELPLSIFHIELQFIAYYPFLNTSTHQNGSANVLVLRQTSILLLDLLHVKEIAENCIFSMYFPFLFFMLFSKERSYKYKKSWDCSTYFDVIR